MFITCLVLILTGMLSANSLTKEIGKPRELYEANVSVQHSIEMSFPETEIHMDHNYIIPYRLEVFSPKAERAHPIFVVIRQENSVDSWQLPLLVEAPNPNSPTVFVEYKETARTLCVSTNNYATTLKGHLSSAQSHIKSVKHLEAYSNFTLTLSTFSQENVTVSWRANPVWDFYLLGDVHRVAWFSPGKPVYYAYEFPDEKTQTVQLQVQSVDDVCFTLSIQPHICPIYDLHDHVTYQGKYLTVQNKGGLTIYRKDFEYNNKASFVVVFVAHADNFECDTHETVHQIDTPEFKENRQDSMAAFQIQPSMREDEYSLPISVLLMGNLGLCLLIMLITIRRCSQTRTLHEATSHVNRDELLTKDVVDRIQNKKRLTIADFNHQARNNRRMAMSYFWHIFNIAIFYGVPVVQLMLFNQRTVNYTGDLDLCYYNNLCSHPLYFNDFNHVFSNVGYVTFGVLFLLITAFRHCCVRIKEGCGIPKLFGLYYAMGVALIIEGVLSASYHICPNQTNFQFDTSFMYVMAVLIMAKLYQNRHPDVQASVYSTFTVLGLSAVVAMFGILYNSPHVLNVFLVIYIALCVYMAFKLYFFTKVTRRICKNFRKLCSGSGFCTALAPKRPALFIFVLIAFLINISMALSGFYLYPKTVDFGTYLLMILMGNAVLYSIYYMIRKILSGESLCWEAILYGLLALGFWLAGGFFFFQTETLWSKTPAQSRLLNKSCILFGFYDTHDIWHILSAPALFFSFAFLSVMDDDLVNTDWEYITIKYGFGWFPASYLIQ